MHIFKTQLVAIPDISISYDVEDFDPNRLSSPFVGFYYKGRFVETFNCGSITTLDMLFWGWVSKTAHSIEKAASVANKISFRDKKPADPKWKRGEDLQHAIFAAADRTAARLHRFGTISSSGVGVTVVCNYEQFIGFRDCLIDEHNMDMEHRGFTQLDGGICVYDLWVFHTTTE